eukprot:TRINITY_DN14055_c0_g1_i1.p1 TRINITY_DN14055_c0_g1~~TRINITY_DN14055_c0_g1_i1.p1  ORF type:complete len:148 (-),score=34.75 TRINITY_DN14055_c0_g1_i1:152-595(-)
MEDADRSKKVTIASLLCYVLLASPLIIAEIVILARTYNNPCDKPLQTFILVCIVTQGVSVLFGIIGHFVPPVKNILAVFGIFFIVWMGLGASWIAKSNDCSAIVPDLYKLSLAVVIIYFAMIGIAFCVGICLVCVGGAVLFAKKEDV